MSLIENAARSICIGLAELEEDGRLISGVRNLHAGVLLLIKEKLRRMSPPDSNEVLIKMMIVPTLTDDGKLVFRGSGRNTVDIQQMKDRLDSLGVDVDWSRINSITRLRNNIEHYYTTESPGAIRALVANVYAVLRDFTRKHLDEDPLELFGTESWEEMLGAAEVFEVEKRECLVSLNEVEWGSETLREALLHRECQTCGSSLLSVPDSSAHFGDAALRCRSCGEEQVVREIIESCLEEYLSYRTYRNVKEGGIAAVLTCPECCLDTYVVDERRCAACEHEHAEECEDCGQPLHEIGELEFGNLCSWCAHMRTKR